MTCFWHLTGGFRSFVWQTVVLPCQYNSVSTQIPVVQWVYKSYCRDRTRDSFNLYDSPGGGLGTGGSGSVGIKVGGGGYETRVMASYLDCSDNSRTVRTVASISGSSITLSEYYKNRDISIINKADLRIGEVQWGDSGVYICKVVISDDLEGQNEASVELLVLGFSGVPEDLLPDIDLKIMPEWVFVTAVALGSVLFILFFGICWCQCCPHSCCCYVSCWCCPDTCCCPRHLYEAGKGIKTRTATPQTPAYPPYFVTGVPTMLPIAPPSLLDKISSVPPSEGTMLSTAPMHAVGLPYRVPSPQDQDSLRLLQYVEKQLAHFNPAASISRQSCSLSELSSLHEGENGFHHTYRNIQKKALPTIPDQDPQPETQRFCNNRSPVPQRLVDHGSPEHQRYCDKPPSPKRFNDHGEPAHQRRHSDDHSLPSQLQRPGCDQQRHPHDREDKHNRWNPRSEHLERKTYRAAERRGSLDELEEFASFHKLRAGRGTEKKAEDHGEYEMERLEYCRYPSHRNGPPQHYYEEESELRGNANEDHTRRGRKNKNNISPLPSPQRRRGTWDNDRPVPAPPTVSPSSSAQEKDYDAVFLNSLLERKAKLRGFGKSKNADDSDTPSKGSSKKSSSESTRYCGHSPSNRPEVDSLPPHLDTGRSRTDRQSPRPPAARSSPSPCLSVPNSREESRDRSRKVNTHLSRDSLIV
ncbi:immunoglobulin-like domain-containing receptor 2 isoform X3 [Cynoglossus semilaevis]|uniref:immunoglobulin-like domain-containing receptor 2 isoform X3 n=1 Tax=Cynoglossus semilaevis TaxID=244447 RepID=UPI000D62F376|nr:immunoglobulin-like domain-containing receptor 2 isoform X3 [Cynoglossus semilaevis]